MWVMVRHCHCLQNMWHSLREKAKHNYTFKKYCIPVLSSYLPCSKEPRESTGQGPQVLPLSSVCSASREGSCQGANDHMLAFIKVQGSAIKRTARKSAERAYLLKREVRKWELLKEKNRMRNRNSCIKLSLNGNDQMELYKERRE